MTKPPKNGGNTAYRAASQEKYDTLEAVQNRAGDLALKPMEFALLTVFLKNRNRILSRERRMALSFSGGPECGWDCILSWNGVKWRKKVQSGGSFK